MLIANVSPVTVHNTEVKSNVTALRTGLSPQTSGQSATGSPERKNTIYCSRYQDFYRIFTEEWTKDVFIPAWAQELENTGSDTEVLPGLIYHQNKRHLFIQTKLYIF